MKAYDSEKTKRESKIAELKDNIKLREYSELNRKSCENQKLTMYLDPINENHSDELWDIVSDEKVMETVGNGNVWDRNYLDNEYILPNQVLWDSNRLDRDIYSWVINVSKEGEKNKRVTGGLRKEGE